MFKWFFSLLFLTFSLANAHNVPFKRVVLWGHKMHSHTHSYIHWGFSRAFKHLGYETLWLDNNDTIRGLDLSSSLFITEGQVDQNIPILQDSYYIIHNCAQTKYKELIDNGRCIILQVYTHDVIGRDVQEVGPFTFTTSAQSIIYMPWATDLLPHEIDEIKKKNPFTKRSNRAVYWIGTIGQGTFGNWNELNEFNKACRSCNITLEDIHGCSMEENERLIQESFIAPTIVGTWQKKQGYIPCRIFKNISYGQFGVTNSEAVYELFDKQIVYNPDCYQLFFDAKKKLESLDISELHELMDVVRDKHTYISRIDTLLTFLEQMLELKSK